MYDPNLYVRNIRDDVVIVVVYVDNIIITCSEVGTTIQKVKSNFCLSFDMTDLGLLHYFLGVEFWQTNVGVFMSQTKHAKSLMERFRMAECKLATTTMEVGMKSLATSDSKQTNESAHRQQVGSLIYLASSKMYLSFAISYMARFTTAPKADHWMICEGHHRAWHLVW